MADATDAADAGAEALSAGVAAAASVLTASPSPSTSSLNAVDMADGDSDDCSSMAGEDEDG